MDTYISIFLAGVFTIFYLFLSMRVGYMRGSPVMKIFFKMEKNISEDKLHRNIRAHGNFSEYVPIYLILIFLIEASGSVSISYLIITSIIFSYGRIAHAICFCFFDYNPFLRISGMITTYLGLLLLAIQAIYLGVLFYLEPEIIVPLRISTF